MGPPGKLGCALGAVDKCAELTARLGDSAKTAEGLRPIRERILHRVDIDVLSVIRAVGDPPTHAYNRNRPCTFDPAALIDLVDQ